MLQHYQDRIGNALAKFSQPVQVSFEFFPANNEVMAQSVWQTIERLSPLEPRFVSVTYGADGSTRERTQELVTRLLKETSLTTMPHMTCVNASRDEVQDIARQYWNMGIRHIMALRGDPAPGKDYVPRPDGYAYAADLVSGLKQVGDFELSVAAYPETHPQAPSSQFDLDYLKAKIDAGATRAITQFFFDTDQFLRFRERCAAAGISASIVPGIMPITRFAQTQRFAQRCGAQIPHTMAQLFAGIDDDQTTQQMLAYACAIEQVQRLQSEGVDEFHFYTLNRAELTYALCHALGCTSNLHNAAPANAALAS